MNQAYIKRQVRLKPSEQSDVFYFGFYKPDDDKHVVDLEKVNKAREQYEANAKVLKLKLTNRRATP